MPRANKNKKKNVTTIVVAKNNSNSKSRPSNRPKKSMNKIPRNLIETVCGLNDPFCPEADSAKYPTSAKIKSLAYPRHYRETMICGNDGRGAVLLLPNLANSSVVFPSAWSADLMVPGPLVPRSYIAGDSCRLVSIGFVLRRISAPLTSSGMVSIRVYTVQDGSTLGTIDCRSYFCDQRYDVPLQDLKEFCITLKRVDDQAYLFRKLDYNAGSASATSYRGLGFQIATIQIDGYVAGTGLTYPVDIEVFEHWEYTFGEGTANAVLALPSPTFNPIIKSASDLVSSETVSFFKSGLTQASSYFVNKALKAVGSLMMARISPATTALSMIQNVD